MSAYYNLEAQRRRAIRRGRASAILFVLVGLGLLIAGLVNLGAKIWRAL